MVSTLSRLRALFDDAGAHFIELPVLHPADPFLETAGEDIRRRMFVTEGPTGERLALRPDFTIPVCLEHLRSGAGAERYAYHGLVFRRHDSGVPERLETGYEDIGRAEIVDADAAALSLALSTASLVTAGPFSVRLGDIAVFDAVLRALHLPGRWRRRLRRSFGLPAVMERNLSRLVDRQGAEGRLLDPELRSAVADGKREQLVALLSARRAAHGHSETAGRSPAEIAERFLDGRAVHDQMVAERARDALTDYLGLHMPLEEADAMLLDFARRWRLDVGDALSRFARRAKAIGGLRPQAEIRFEAGFGRPLDYYTGLVFEISAAGLADPLVGGGRYDRLLEMLGSGEPVPAVGFTMRLDLAAGEADR
jgi:ATP phosphoribosyltransferase regulatory subunit